MVSGAPHTTKKMIISPLLLSRLSEFVEALLGLHFPPVRLSDLQRGIASAAREFGFTDINRCMEWLLSATLTRSQIETLAGYLTIGETYFFRDKKVFNSFETKIFPEFFDARRGRDQNLRIWSAGCSTGEEAYSLGILLARILPDLEDWNISILATDIDPNSLKKAAEGVYGEWSFRDTPSWIKERWFEKRGRNYAVAPRIKQMVTFSSLNLVDDEYPAILNGTNAMDIIFCRNVLMYFSRERAYRVIANLARCLVDRGWLVIGPVEAPGSRLSPLLHPVTFPETILYRKGTLPESGVQQAIALPAEAISIPATNETDHLAKTRPVTADTRPQKHDFGQMAVQARLLADQGKLADALTLCEAAIQIDKLNPTLHYLQSTILQEMNRSDDAEAALKRTIYIDQEFTVAHFVLGHLMQRRGKAREAEKHLEKARTLLKSSGHDEILSEAEGLDADRLIELMNKMEGKVS